MKVSFSSFLMIILYNWVLVLFSVQLKGAPVLFGYHLHMSFWALLLILFLNGLMMYHSDRFKATVNSYILIVLFLVQLLGQVSALTESRQWGGILYQVLFVMSSLLVLKGTYHFPRLFRDDLPD